MGILNVCKVVTAIGQLKKDGTSALPADVAYYFQGSSAFNDPTFATCTGIEMIPADKWDGSHPLVPVAQLIAANILNRLSVVVQATGTKKKTRYEIVVKQEKVSKIIDGTAAEQLDGKSFKLINRSGATVDKGTVIRVGGKTSQYNP
jgi:hypothetical protein